MYIYLKIFSLFNFDKINRKNILNDVYINIKEGIG